MDIEFDISKINIYIKIKNAYPVFDINGVLNKFHCYIHKLRSINAIKKRKEIKELKSMLKNKRQLFNVYENTIENNIESVFTSMKRLKVY